MIFGILLDDPTSIDGRLSARLNFDHFESFILLILFEKGHGPEPYKMLGKQAFEDHCASYGVAPDSPEFKRFQVEQERRDVEQAVQYSKEVLGIGI